MIYLDYAATTPIAEDALTVYMEASRHFFGNPHSLHDIGSHASQLLEKSRGDLGALLNVSAEALYFTSGGSESNTLALQALIEGSQKHGHHLITTAAEHSSVFNFFKEMEKRGYEVSYLSFVEKEADMLEQLQKAIKKTTVLASIQHGNGETGFLHPIEQIGKLLKENNILFHSDCVQTFGKVPLNLQKIPVDSISISSHKVYGPKGVGAIYINPATIWAAPFPGITHEKGLRPGTVNVPGIAAFVTAAKAAHENMASESVRLLSYRNKLIKELSSLPFNIKVEGETNSQLPHVLGLRFEGMEGQYFMLECNRQGLAVSTGSACQAGKQAPSRTLISMGRTETEARQFIRLSPGKQTTDEEIETALHIIHAILSKYFS